MNFVFKFVTSSTHQMKSMNLFNKPKGISILDLYYVCMCVFLNRNKTTRGRRRRKTKKINLRIKKIHPNFKSIMADNKYIFIVEWYDTAASLIRTYYLTYFTIDKTIEMVKNLKSIAFRLKLR